MSDQSIKEQLAALQATLAASQAENANLKAQDAQRQAKVAKRQTISFKVSEKKAVSVYGLSARFPTTLYVQQWARLIAKLPELQAFIEAHRSELATKDDS